MDKKILLKQAREAIKNKEYETSLKLAKAILKDDKYNYMALIFLGLSLQEIGPIEQAPKAFRKAIELNDSNPLGWNGIINYYEKLNNEESKNVLTKLYADALKFETSEKKIIEYSEKLADTCHNGDIAMMVDIIYKSSSKLSENQCIIYEIVIKLLESQEEIPKEFEPIYEKCLIELTNNTSLLKCNYFSSYLTLLYKQCKYNDLMGIARKMHCLFESDTISLIWICKVYNQLFLEEPDIAEKYFEVANKSYAKLLEVDPKNAIGLFTKSIVLIKENELIDAKDVLTEVTAVRPGLLHAWVLLLHICIKLNLNEQALQVSSTIEKLLRSINYSNKALKDVFDGQMIELLSKSKNLEDLQKVIDLYKQVSDEESKKKYVAYVVEAYINLGKIAEAKLLISDLKAYNEALSKLLHAKCLYKEEKYQEALSLIENDTRDVSEWWFQIGILYWKLEEYKKCLVPFLKAAKLDSNNYLIFLYLGNYYQKMSDIDKARRCYEKAFKINSKSQEVVTELSKIYCKQKNWEASQSILQSLTIPPINKNNSWAWLQLGLSYLEQEDYSKAIDNLRFVIRIEEDNVHCWEALADAYFARASYTSALHCYEKSLELTNNPLYPLLQISNIKKILGQYSEAKLDFEEILLSNGQYVPALKGLAETCMCQAEQCYRDQRLGTARNLIQTAIDKLTMAVQQRPNFSCLWKLLADSCVFVAKLPEKYCCLFMSESLLDGKDNDAKRMIEKRGLYTCGTRFYCKAINLTDDNFPLWHDLGTSYLNHALHTDEAEEKELLLSYSLAAAKHCTEHDPTNWQHWNLMGNIAMQQDPPNYALAQHLYIKAVTVDHNSAVAWSNLGILYLLMDDLILANKAFAQGQRSDPDYVNSWIGQAMIAEKMGHEEAMDLFRHSTQLAQQQQGGVGYGHWVCQTLLNVDPGETIYSIHNMHAIPVACDVLSWYTEKNPYDGTAWNMLGILRERMGLKQGTLEAFKNAYRLCDKTYRDKARINYGRILAKLGKYTNAINIFQEVQEATFNSGSGLALALFKDKQYEESYSAYEQALHWLTDKQKNQSELLVALASMAYMFQDADNAKTLLFQSIQLKPPSPWGLYATLSLALIHEDTKLAKLVLDELETLKDHQDCLPHYAALSSYYHLQQDSRHKAILEMSKLTHRHPNNATLWLILSVLLLRTQGQRKQSSAAAKCAQVAMIFGQSNIDITKVLGLVALSSLVTGNFKNAIVSSQKAIHCYPNVADGWTTLWSALNNEKAKYSKEATLKILQHIQTLDVPRELRLWVEKQQTCY